MAETVLKNKITFILAYIKDRLCKLISPKL